MSSKVTSETQIVLEKANMQKLFPILLLMFILLSCTTIQSRSSATAHIEGVGYDKAFSIATQSAMNAGLTITSVSKEAGLIMATRGSNAFLTGQNPIMNIAVNDTDNGVAINIASTVGGQLIDYGTTSGTIHDFCDALSKLTPSAACVFQ
jgi:hypothetical protein